jgi:hypothetical protein
MSEKVLREIQVIETDEGFRIELKGDKEELRAIVDRLTQAGPFGGRGWGFGPFGRREHGHEHGHGPFGRHRHGPFGGHHHGPSEFFFERHFEPSEETPREDFRFEKRKLREAARQMRRFGGRWEARWGYDLGPWWDDDDAPPPPTTPGVEPTGEPPADV